MEVDTNTKEQVGSTLLPSGDRDHFLISVGDHITGISMGKEKSNTIAVTCKKKGVRVYEIFDQQCIKNWTAPRGLRFQGTAVQDVKTRAFFAQTSSHSLATWAHNSLDISRKNEKKVGGWDQRFSNGNENRLISKPSFFDEEIFQIHCGKVARKKWSLVVVMKNEKVLLLDHKLNAVATLEISPKECILWSDLITIDGDDYLLTIYQQGAQYFLHVFTLYNEPCIRERSYFPLTSPSEKTIGKPVAACLQSDLPPYFALLWSTGRCDVWEFESISHLTDSSKGLFLKQKTALSELYTGGETDEGHCMPRLFSINQSLLGAVGTAADGSGVRICTYNAMWGTLLDMQSVKTPSGVLSHVVYNKDSHVVAMSFDKDICICKLKEASGSLAEALGSLADTPTPSYGDSSADLENIYSPITVDANLGHFAHLISFGGDKCSSRAFPKNHLEFLDRRNEYDLAVIKVFMDREVVTSEEQFTIYVRRYLNRYTPESLKNQRIQSKKSVHSELIQVSPLFVKEISKRCMEDHYWEALKILLLQGLISYSMHKDTLFDTLMEHNQADLLHVCLLRMHDIEERTLMKLIEYYIKNRKEDFMVSYLVSVLEIKEDEKPSVMPDGYQFLNLIFNMPANEAFTVQSLHLMETSVVVELLRYLLRLLEYFGRESTTKYKFPFTLCVPHYENVINWMTMIVDAQSTNLLLTSEKCVELLAEVKAELQRHISICQTTQYLQGWLTHIMQRKDMPMATRQTYSVESFYA